MSAYARKAKQRVTALIEALETLHTRDPEQEVQGMAVPVFDAVIEAVKDDIGRNNPVVAAVAGVISAETIEAGEAIRAADALLVAKMLDAEIGPRPSSVSVPRGRLDRPRFR
jgi:CRISPR/Cas system-associated protein Cas7 (RAMP superfamily)